MAQSKQPSLAMLQKLNFAQADELKRLKSGGGGGTSGGMDGRVSRLEALVDVTREDLRDIKGDLRTLIDTVTGLPTKRDLDTWRWQWVATAFAIIALTVGGITGGLALIASY